MTGMHVLAAALSLGLLVYLGIALLQPERFQ
jgi:K+-transporting ATPase KdpF subunit